MCASATYAQPLSDHALPQVVQSHRAKKFIVVDMKHTSGRKKMLVLEAIPYDRLVRAGEIASKTGISPRAVGIIIRWNLMPFVEMKEIDDPKPRTKVYKRRPNALEPTRPRD